MLDDLVSVIETLQRRIRDHGPTLRQNETRTRTALIDPLLTALGWDVSDPALVTPEYRVDVGWADYALAGPGSQPAAVIEAKRLGSIVENHLEQSVGYCIQQGIAYSGVTDGDHWQLYRTFEPVPMAQKLVLDIRIGDTPAHECALKLLLLWRPNLASGKAISAEEPVFAVVREPECAPTPTVTETIAPVPAPASFTPSTVQQGWVRLSDVKPEKGKKPRGVIKFPDEETRAISDWMNVLEESGKWLYGKRYLRPDNCTLPNSNSQRAQYITHTQPFHKSGRHFATTVELGPGVFVELNFAPMNVVQAAAKILQHCGIDPATVQLQVEQ